MVSDCVDIVQSFKFVVRIVIHQLCVPINSGPHKKYLFWLLRFTQIGVVHILPYTSQNGKQLIMF